MFVGALNGRTRTSEREKLFIITIFISLWIIISNSLDECVWKNIMAEAQRRERAFAVDWPPHSVTVWMSEEAKEVDEHEMETCYMCKLSSWINY